MEKVYVFRVLIDYEKDVFRDIQIKTSQSFTEFHTAIQNAFDFDGQQMSSFYLSNNDWDKGEEIAMEHISETQTNPLMHNTTIEQLVTEMGQKLVYVSDFLLMWCFFIELVKIEEVNMVSVYPLLSHSYGDAPKQDDKEFDLDDSLPLMDEKSKDDDPYADLDKDDDDIFEGFDDFEQFEY
jgi:hypothetical protein